MRTSFVLSTLLLAAAASADETPIAPVPAAHAAADTPEAVAEDIAASARFLGQAQAYNRKVAAVPGLLTKNADEVAKNEARFQDERGRLIANLGRLRSWAVQAKDSAAPARLGALPPAGALDADTKKNVEGLIKKDEKPKGIPGAIRPKKKR